MAEHLLIACSRAGLEVEHVMEGEGWGVEVVYV